MIFYFVFFLFVLFWVFTLFFTIKYRNPYRLVMVFGKKGAGKTTFLARTAVKAHRRGRVVYSTVPVPYAKKLRVSEIGHRQFPENSVILIDEVGMIWDNRDFKNFKPEVRDFFKLQRHMKITVYLFSQTFDVDVKIRNLTDKMILIVNPLGWFSYCRTIRRTIKIVEASAEAESRIADDLKISGILGLFVGSTFFIFIPRWKRYFDSFALDQKLPIPDQPWDVDVPRGIFEKKFQKIFHFFKSLLSHRCRSASDES